MGIMKNIIDGNEAASKYTEYMRKARRDGDKMPTRKVRDPEKRALARELNNELDKLHYGYEPTADNADTSVCERCKGPLGPGSRVIRSIYPDHKPRIDYSRCGNC